MSDSSDNGGRGEVSLEDDVNPIYQTGCTMCTGDRSDNIWFVNGQCRLDQLTYEQVVYVLKRIPGAADQLRKITSDPTLLVLANETATLAQEEAAEQSVHDRINKNNTLPFYTVFRGNPEGGVR